MKQLEVFCYTLDSIIAGELHSTPDGNIYGGEPLAEQQCLDIFRKYSSSKDSNSQFSIITTEHSHISISPTRNLNFLDFWWEDSTLNDSLDTLLLSNEACLKLIPILFDEDSDEEIHAFLKLFN